MIPAGDAFLMRMETEGSLPRKIFLGRQLYWRAKNEVKDWIQLRMEEK
jgi:predicted DNA-binding transcriptional regulator AlpA